MPNVTRAIPATPAAWAQRVGGESGTKHLGPGDFERDVQAQKDRNAAAQQAMRDAPPQDARAELLKMQTSLRGQQLGTLEQIARYAAEQLEKAIAAVVAFDADAGQSMQLEMAKRFSVKRSK